VGFSELLANADRAVRDVLGQAVTYAPGSGDPVEATGVFDKVYVRVDLGQPGVSSSGPAVFLSLADLPVGAPTDRNAVLTIDGTDYTIHEIQPDGQGGAVFLLHLA
jgi:hypothetical protein